MGLPIVPRGDVTAGRLTPLPSAGVRSDPRRRRSGLDERSRTRTERKVLLVSLGGAAVLWATGALNVAGLLVTPLAPSESTGWFPALDFLVLGVVLALLPYGLVRWLHLRRVEALERRLPDFLEDVAESGSHGLTFAEAIQASSKGQYGELTAEVERMSTQIAWGIPVADALAALAKRVPTPLVRQSVTIALRAQQAGGPYPEVLRRVARDVRQVQLARTRRAGAMGTYVTVVYLAFFVFLLTIYVLAALFLPQMLTASGGGPALGFGGLVGTSVVTSLFLALLLAVLLHGIGDGLVSGFLARGRWSDGLPHAAVLLAVGWFVLRFIVPPVGGGG